MRPTQIPAVTASLWADYSLQRGALAGLGLGAGVRHIGSTYGDAANTIAAPAATLADAAVYYDSTRSVWRSTSRTCSTTPTWPRRSRATRRS